MGSSPSCFSDASANNIHSIVVPVFEPQQERVFHSHKVLDLLLADRDVPFLASDEDDTADASTPDNAFSENNKVIIYLSLFP